MSVRWDAVVDRAAVEINQTPPPFPANFERPCTGRIRARVQLFGALAPTNAERALELELPATGNVADLLATLGERMGEPFLSQVLDESGQKRRCCRVFVDGNGVEDSRTALNTHSEPMQIEIILLVAPEGG